MVESRTYLETFKFSRRLSKIGWRGLTAGINWSDLGFAAGELMESLSFLLDAQDDEDLLDPVVIVGLPRDGTAQ